MSSDKLSMQLKHLLEVVDRLEFNAEQNRRQIAEMRLLVVNVARDLHIAESARKAKGNPTKSVLPKERKK